MIFNSVSRDLVINIKINKVIFNYNLIWGTMFIVILHLNPYIYVIQTD